MARGQRLLLLARVPSLPARAELRLLALVSDHIVLQRAKPLPVLGWAETKAAVTVSFAGASQSTRGRAA